MVWGFFGLVFYMVFWFSAGLMFFWFSGGSYFLIFWWFLMVFLIFLRFFFARFYLVLLTKMGTIFKILLQFFFFRVYCPPLMRWPVKVTGAEFTALRLVFNRICKSIKKYKTRRLAVASCPRLQVATYFLRFYQFLSGKLLMSTTTHHL